MERQTFKTKSFISTPGGIIELPWATGQTDSDVFRLRDAAVKITGKRMVVHSAFAKDEYTGRYGAFRFGFQSDDQDHRITVSLFVVREYTD